MVDGDRLLRGLHSKKTPAKLVSCTKPAARGLDERLQVKGRACGNNSGLSAGQRGNIKHLARAQCDAGWQRSTNHHWSRGQHEGPVNPIRKRDRDQISQCAAAILSL